LFTPFRPAAFEATWRTPDVLALAEGIDEGLAFDGLPALADALEEAGCANTTLLAHLRSPACHVRGCWALGLVLRRE
jgi:hypothetical protein